MVETGLHLQVSSHHPSSIIDPRRWQYQLNQLVHRFWICNTSQHDKSYSNDDDNGQGLHLCIIWKKKINTKISTEAELVGIRDALSQIIWYHNFLRSQGYQVNKPIIYQDNQSTIQICNNGRVSRSRRTRHIDIHYLFITYHIESKEVRV